MPKALSNENRLAKTWHMRLTATLLLTSVMNIGLANTSPSVKDLIASIANNHPKILELEAKKQQIDLQKPAALGVFDPTIAQQTRLRGTGYYDGQYAEQKISKPLRFMNAEVYGSYRVADGDFPEYEGNMRTLSGGEAGIGLALSLLKNRDFDKRRAELIDADLNAENWQSQQQYFVNQILSNGISSYLDWHQANLQLKVYENLVATTEENFTAIKARVDKGDLAAINLTEFNTTLLQRQISLIQAERKLNIARQKLLFYWRDPSGQMFPISTLENTVDNIKWPLTINDNELQFLLNKVEEHPLLKALKAERLLADNKVRLTKNDLQPSLDLDFKVDQDMGNGSDTLEDTEAKVGLSFKMPLGQRTAKAKHRSAKSKVRELDLAYQTLQDELSQNLRQSITDLQYARELVNLQNSQTDVAGTLSEQEKTRFNIGASNLFLLNSREATLIQAQLNAISAQIDVYRNELKVWHQTGQLGQFIANSVLQP